MIGKEIGKHYLVCDICGDYEEFDTWGEAVDFKKTEGWGSKKTKQGWMDFCPNCKEDKE